MNIFSQNTLKECLLSGLSCSELSVFLIPLVSEKVDDGVKLDHDF